MIDKIKIYSNKKLPDRIPFILNQTNTLFVYLINVVVIPLIAFSLNMWYTLLVLTCIETDALKGQKRMEKYYGSIS